MEDLKQEKQQQQQQQRRQKWSHVFCAALIGACLNGLVTGTLAAWPQAAIPQLLSDSYGFTEAQASWIAGITFLGMLVGGFASVPIASSFGRRRLFLLAGVPLALSWSVIAVAASFWQFMFGRLIQGLGGGMMSYQTEMYISEVSPPGQRSKNTVLFCASIHLGVLLSFAVGPILTVSSATGVYLSLVLLLAGVYLVAAPETPFWLVRRARSHEALETLRRLRATSDVHDEFEDIVEFVERSAVATKGEGTWSSSGRVLEDPASRKAILLVVLLTTAQQFSGMGAMYTYAQLIFERSASAIPGRYVSLLIGLIELCCTTGSSWLVGRVGRRPHAALTSIICAIAMALMGCHFHGTFGDPMTGGGTLPIVCIVVFSLAYGLGFSSLPTVVAAECLSMDARNLGAATQNMTTCLSVLLVTKLWQVIASSYGQEYSFWLTALITAGHTIALLLILPETRGLSLVEIQRLLVSSSSSSSASTSSCRSKSTMLLEPSQQQGLRNVKIVPVGQSS